MKVLISAIHYPVSAARFLAEGYRRLGHTVVTLGPTTGGMIPWGNGQDFSAYAWTPDVLLEPAPPIVEMPMKSIEDGRAYVEQIAPDLLVQCDANLSLDGVSGVVPNVCWAVDNHVAKYDDVPFDVVFGAHSWGYQSDKENFVWLPCAYDPKEHYQIEGAFKHFDAAMIGVMYLQRKILLNALAEHGSVLAGTGVLGERYNEAYNSARIAIVQSVCGDVPMRVFENAAQGLALLVDRNERDLMRLGLEEGEHFLGYADPDEAVAQFQYLKKRAHVCERMADRARRKLAQHTYEARAQTILDTCRQRGLL